MLDDGRLQLVDALGTKLAKLDSKVVAALKPYVPDNLHPGETAVLLDLDPYERSFHHVSTHLFLPELSERAVRDALTAGRAFVSFEWIADPTGFNFQALHGADVYEMGSEVPFAKGLSVRSVSPLPARFRLIRNGKEVHSAVRPFLFASARIARQLSLGSLAQSGRNARGFRNPLQPDLRPRLTSGSLEVHMRFVNRCRFPWPRATRADRGKLRECRRRDYRTDSLSRTCPLPGRRSLRCGRRAFREESPADPGRKMPSLPRQRTAKRRAAARFAGIAAKRGRERPRGEPGASGKKRDWSAQSITRPTASKCRRQASSTPTRSALTEWIREGATWPASSSGGGGPSATRMDFAKRAEHWSFQPLRRSVSAAGG